MATADATIQTCPRRMNEWGPWVQAEGLDRWQPKDRNGNLFCSFCGSLHPDQLMEMIKSDAAILGVTTKNYKVYVDSVPTEEQKELARQKNIKFFVDSGVSEEVATEKVNEIVSNLRGSFAGKFYFMHFSKGQMQEFVELYNAKKLKFEGGMSFNPLPFFMAEVGKEG